MLSFAAVAIAALALEAPQEPLWTQARSEKDAVVATLRELVEIESGSRDKEGLDRLAALLATQLGALGAAVETYEPSPADIVRLFDTPKEIGKVVIGRFRGTGTRRIMLLAHMDTVYGRGTLADRPFRVEGSRAYGPGIADDKGGIAVVLHALKLLRATGFRDYGTLTVVVNGDEELSSPGARRFIERMGAQHDVVLSCEPALVGSDGLLLATSGIGVASLTVRGRAAHAGIAPQEGRNAIVELAHQILETRDLSDPARRIKFNWTLASGGKTRNVIPELATATADVRVNAAADFDVIEKRFRERAGKTTLVPDAKVEATFERRRTPLQPTDASRAVARRAQAIYAELGRTLGVDESGTGGGTDAAFAAASGKPAVVENFGLVGAGYHSSEAEYVDLDSIAPRLYLLARLVVEESRR
jgi:glutamate carboxypeptidase